MNRFLGRIRPGSKTAEMRVPNRALAARSSSSDIASNPSRGKVNPSTPVCSIDSNRIPLSLTTLRPVSHMETDPEIAPDAAELFDFTRGRFVTDEQHQLAQRHRVFNVVELARHAAHSVKADRCVRIQKYPDGMYNRVLLLSMDNGKEVVVKIPNPNAGQPHFTTSSEVATMKFAREVPGTPLPEVFAWSSRANNIPVGAEFILMERLEGVALESLLPNMKVPDRFEVVKSIATYQKSWASLSFAQYGSLYFREDIDELTSSALVYTDHSGREIPDRFDRGPWRSLEDYHAALGNRELVCVQHIPDLPTSPISLRGPGLYQPTRAKKTRALQAYLKLFPYLLPKNLALRSAHLWHGDLHAGNIIVDPANPSRVVGLIDCQSVELAPLYFQARQPHFIDHDGLATYDLKEPTLLLNFAELDRSEKAAA